MENLEGTMGKRQLSPKRGAALLVLHIYYLLLQRQFLIMKAPGRESTPVSQNWNKALKSWREGTIPKHTSPPLSVSTATPGNFHRVNND